MNCINLIISSIALLFAFSQAQAGEVNNLNTFVSGQPALASEINTNFSLVEAAVATQPVTHRTWVMGSSGQYLL